MILTSKAPEPIPCCENCPLFSYIEQEINVGKKCPSCGCPISQMLKLPACNGTVIQYAQMVTKEKGCLSHPRSREYLMRDKYKRPSRSVPLTDLKRVSQLFCDTVDTLEER